MSRLGRYTNSADYGKLRICSEYMADDPRDSHSILRVSDVWETFWRGVSTCSQLRGLSRASSWRTAICFLCEAPSKTPSPMWSSIYGTTGKSKAYQLMMARSYKSPLFRMRHAWSSVGYACISLMSGSYWASRNVVEEGQSEPAGPHQYLESGDALWGCPHWAS